jgi:streptogramin lyase
MGIHKSKTDVIALTLGFLAFLSVSLKAQSLSLHVVHLPIQSYRLLAMAMDEDGDIWFGSIHHVIHRYTPSTGAVETIPLPQTTANYKLWASQCLAANRKIYILGQAYPKLVIYDRQTKSFSEESYPSPKPDVWFGVAHPDGRHLYFFDRGGVGIIKWDSKTDTGRAIPYHYKTQLPSFGRYDPRDHAIWCGIWDYTDGKYIPNAITRFDVESDSFAGIYYFPKDETALQPYSNPDTTIFYPWTLQGKMIPFDFQTKRWCKFMDVPEFGKRYGFIGMSTLHHGNFYFSLSTYNSDDDLGIDGQQYHFANFILTLDPKTRKFDFLTLDMPGAYYQIAYVLSAHGQFYATGSNILTPEGRIVRENRGEIIVWQTQSLKRGGKTRSRRSVD